MVIWTHGLKFNVGTGGIHQIPQTTGDGIHSLLQEVVSDVGGNVPNPALQLFHCARFFPAHLLLCPAPQDKVTGREIWTSCRPFVRSSSSQPKSRKLLIQPGKYAQCKVWRCAIVHENKVHGYFSSQVQWATRNLPTCDDSVRHSWCRVVAVIPHYTVTFGPFCIFSPVTPGSCAAQ
jgi:hypothetical protein